MTLRGKVAAVLAGVAMILAFTLTMGLFFGALAAAILLPFYLKVLF